MKTFFLDLFNYNDHYNDKIITTLNENPANISDRCMKLLSHVLNVHRIWNYKIKAGEDLYERFEIHPIQKCHDINKKNHEDSILILDTFDLDRPIQYALSTGQSFTNSIRDLLFHVINHSTYHRGQIATEFRQSGFEPLMTDYLLYKMK